MPAARLAWRNLWRNPRRTWLTAGGIAFAVWMLEVAAAMQAGSFGAMVDNAARLGPGHLQLQHPGFSDDPRLEYVLPNAPELLRVAEALPGVAAVLPRTQAFALVSVGDRSFGVAVIGVDPAREARGSRLPELAIEGRYLEGPGEAFIGTALARNLAVRPGDELVLLGTAREGGVAAGVVREVGIFESGQAELDRSMLQIPIDDFRAAWSLGQDEMHTLALLLDRADDTESVAAQLGGAGHAVRTWEALMPEARQTIELKQIGAELMFGLLAVIVTFSVVNTFVMTVFERTREFGMLMALGMRPGAIVVQLRLEALWLAVLGILLGIGAAAAVIGVLMLIGVPLPAEAAELLARYNLPARVYPRFSFDAAAIAALAMLAGTQLAVWLPAMRVRRLRPVEALRAPD